MRADGDHGRPLRTVLARDVPRTRATEAAAAWIARAETAWADAEEGDAARCGVTVYWELLRDPRWQRKRLEVMQAAGFQCQECSSAIKTLNVHHTFYRRGAKPWEYETAELRCLCEDCHRLAGLLLERLHRHIGAVSMYTLPRIDGYIRAHQVIDSGGSLVLDFDEFTIGVADAFGIRPDDLLALAAAREGACFFASELVAIATEQIKMEGK